MKTFFACHGLPEKLRSDNGPQFSSANFKNCTELGIEHERSSPHFQSSNGEAERAVQTIKSLWTKCVDKQLALLDYRTTPLENINLSPAQLLMGRRPRKTLPASYDILKPATHDLRKVKQHLNAQKAKQKLYYDRRRNVKELSPLDNGTTVRMETPGSKSLSPGIVVEKTDKSRSYLVKSKGRLYRRNRVHLHKSSENPQDEVDEQDMPMEDSGPNEPTIENTATPEVSDKPANHKTHSKPDLDELLNLQKNLTCEVLVNNSVSDFWY
ncbi:uncharacterized protein K02A2.6-like [Saccostrea echinata]|uniref:uncharacterized protein K02A2.6-like n=1 Tax=Saccostrea echinata TaxID=191078 RepID=UPI002A80CEA6|nr:uncharacterized protein K02A2.6-like [Saccostrea echinata]